MKVTGSYELIPPAKPIKDIGNMTSNVTIVKIANTFIGIAGGVLKSVAELEI